ncbi:hypothetical protein QQ020_14060 [Fulvivirgaceae bacterium BMA12]|uniref:Uncharacterized protein n=1 Tax=Agaribacillus aureus TaxID=3051825 RepID=A0ABT8L668_9BACT|nr:hypothetical protein [Fulvivirgaceae bacterium BMA12]
MFNFFNKRVHRFYLPSKIYYNILEKGNDISAKTVNAFLNEHGLSVGEKQITVQSISEFLFSITIKFKKRDEQMSFVTFISQFKELLPPWMTFPGIFQGVPRWNQGIEEDYCVLHWLPYWKSLTHNEKEVYMSKYSCPSPWEAWLRTTKF